MADKNDESEKQGVLLYYKYTHSPIADLDHLYTFYESNCSSLGLLGRVRIAPQGVNVTVGGKLSSLGSHIDALLQVKNGLFHGTDFKLASCDEPLNDEVAKECGFTSLSIRIVKELVTLSSNPLLKSPPISNAGKHLSAAEFHSVLQSAGELPNDFKRVVLLDARNMYETRIGKFEPPDVETLDPATRQYSDLPAWIDSNAEKLRGNCILMYCTGGIRCEMASAYIRSKGAGFENVFQLFGGIQRYLEQFPDGGFFKGRNFVYDPRNSSSIQKENAQYVCELCEHGKVALSVPPVNDDSSEIECDTGVGSSKKLRILCLHGFRQNASGFKGRTAALAKKLKSLAELVFVNAPHELPFIYHPTKQHNSCISTPLQSNPPPSRCNKKYAWLVARRSFGKKADEWEKTVTPFDPLQYQQQTEGFDESLSYLKSVFSTQGPFDGILGFSQGAAMVAHICAQRGKLDLGLDFRFVILCSGFPINLAGHERGSINCPSLHVFGNDKGGDRQISSNSSRDLASYFEDGCRMIIEHASGHIIPTQSPYIEEVREFLRRFI
ncbi:hypothetical protein Cgig2_022823 [Carnegiea gigantea]|uniref:Rhodanese domain-containing protein n=1 Tax=Carnegiea gigantea TaxID=171969 RepID=A0A9Q1KP28_9CARY|nr:hypothetical protein Cgig2_022823 [Carnegiea gigantea]